MFERLGVAVLGMVVYVRVRSGACIGSARQALLIDAVNSHFNAHMRSLEWQVASQTRPRTH
jgi:hypothetical protein